MPTSAQLGFRPSEYSYGVVSTPSVGKSQNGWSADRLQTASRYMDRRIAAFQPSEYSGKMFDDLELLPNTPKVFLGFGTAGALAGATVGFVVGALLPGTSKKVCVLAGALVGAGAGLYVVQSDDPSEYSGAPIETLAEAVNSPLVIATGLALNLVLFGTAGAVLGALLPVVTAKQGWSAGSVVAIGWSIRGQYKTRQAIANARAAGF